jgi:hypothetical protein
MIVEWILKIVAEAGEAEEKEEEETRIHQADFGCRVWQQAG